MIQVRLAKARDEMKQARWYDYLIVNERIEEAAKQLKSIIIAERCRRRWVLERFGFRKL